MILLYIWLFFISITTGFIFIGCYIERNFNEDTSVMKWWRKHIIGVVKKDKNIK